MADWLIPVLPLTGVIVGAALQFWFSREGERRRQMETLRAESYVEYLRSIAGAAHACTTDELNLARKAAAYAKSRSAVYGTAEVVAALAQFERSGAVLDNDHSCQAFAEIVSAMRHGRDKVGVDAIRLVLIGAAQGTDDAGQPLPGS